MYLLHLDIGLGSKCNTMHTSFRFMGIYTQEVACYCIYFVCYGAFSSQATIAIYIMSAFSV